MIIAALASAPGKAGISVIRVSGEDSIETLLNYFPKKLREKKEYYNVLSFAGFIYKKQNIDKVTVIFFEKGHSYTGEESAEIYCHGSPIIVKKILEALYSDEKIREAEPGEFTQKRFMNGKTDLVKAEAVIDLINSESDAAYTASKEQLNGGLSIELEKINTILVDLISLLEVELDFSEEDLDFTPRAEILKKVENSVQVINKFVEGYKKGRIFRDGIKVVLVGNVNVGKSSLMNSFLKSDRMIVTDIAGTTRDIIEEKIEVKGYLLRIYDTAGLRNTDDIIEKEGIKRVKQLVSEADIVLHILDSVDPVEEKIEGAQTLIKVYNKSDLKDIEVDDNSVKISCETGQGIEELKDLIVSKVADENMTYQPYYISNIRHLNILKKAVSELKKAESSLKAGQNNEVVILDLREALDTLGELTGETASIDIINNIFGKFCIGK